MLFDNQSRKSIGQLLDKGPVLVSCIYDGVSAKIMELAGYECVYLSGADVAASFCGYPDLGMLGFDEIRTVADRITDMCSIPMIVDLYSAFGNEINVIRCCERMLKAGAKGIVLDDRVFPNLCGRLDKKDVIARDDYMSKLKAAHHVLKTSDCALIACTYAYTLLGQDEVMLRNNMSYEAGADIVLNKDFDSVELVRHLGEKVSGRKMFEMSANKVTLKPTFEELVKWGYSLITVNFAAASANEVMIEFARKSLEDGSDAYAVDHSIMPDGSQMSAFKNAEMFGSNKWIDLAASFGGKVNKTSALS